MNKSNNERHDEVLQTCVMLRSEREARYGLPPGKKWSRQAVVKNQVPRCCVHQAPIQIFLFILEKYQPAYRNMLVVPLLRHNCR